jgi:hypothetical protein
MPPFILPPPNIRPWKPIIAHVPAPPTAKTNPDLKRYEAAKAEWRGSTPAYRHRNPRPETWIPKTIVDTNYKLPTASEKENRRLEYQEILEEIKERIPPEYYEHFRQKYARPVNFDTEGPDPTGAINGYRPGMFHHPQFMEKDHSKYHALPRKMFPEEEKLYKLQETQHVKESLDILEDNGLDYEERVWLAKQRAAQKKLEDEKFMREEVFRTTHWIDWNSDRDEISEAGENRAASDKPNSLEIKPSTPKQSTPGVPQHRKADVQEVDNGEKLETVPDGAVSSTFTPGLGPILFNSALGVATGATLIGIIYGIWRLVKEHGKRARSADTSGDKELASSNERGHKRSMRLWKSEDND